MSQSKQAPISVSDAFKVPDLEGRHDRYCSNCCGILFNFALEKHRGMKCPRCTQEVDFLDKSDGLYNRCIRCQAMVRCKLEESFNVTNVISLKQVCFLIKTICFLFRYLEVLSAVFQRKCELRTY